MSGDSSRAFSRFYAQLRRDAGEDVSEDTDERGFDSLVRPKVANPRRRDEDEG